MPMFTKIPESTFEKLSLNAGVLLKQFTPTTGTFQDTDMIGATSGGVSFTDTPSFTDFGEDIDNCPKNLKELKRIDSREVKMSGTFASMDTDVAKMLCGAADVSDDKVTPRVDLVDADFNTIWWVGDYSGGADGSFLAIEMKNALSTGGFSLQTADKEKGKYAFEFTAHTSMSAQTEVPYNIYIRTATGA